jgi:hypothetical protein
VNSTEARLFRNDSDRIRLKFYNTIRKTAVATSENYRRASIIDEEDENRPLLSNDQQHSINVNEGFLVRNMCQLLRVRFCLLYVSCVVCALLFT